MQASLAGQTESASAGVSAATPSSSPGSGSGSVGATSSAKSASPSPSPSAPVPRKLTNEVRVALGETGMTLKLAVGQNEAVKSSSSSTESLKLATATSTATPLTSMSITTSTSTSSSTSFSAGLQVIRRAPVAKTANQRSADSRINNELAAARLTMKMSGKPTSSSGRSSSRGGGAGTSTLTLAAVWDSLRFLGWKLCSVISHSKAFYPYATVYVAPWCPAIQESDADSHT
jgi:hypothetical protein